MGELFLGDGDLGDGTPLLDILDAQALGLCTGEELAFGAVQELINEAFNGFGCVTCSPCVLSAVQYQLLMLPTLVLTNVGTYTGLDPDSV